MECEICGYYVASEVVVFKGEPMPENVISCCDNCFDEIEDELVETSYPVAN